VALEQTAAAGLEKQDKQRSVIDTEGRFTEVVLASFHPVPHRLRWPPTMKQGKVRTRVCAARSVFSMVRKSPSSSWTLSPPSTP